jgi:antitoxin component YwqK of YwqJK toxin-antitoxin module
MGIKFVIVGLFILMSYGSECQIPHSANEQFKIEKVNDSVTAIGRYEQAKKQGQWIFFKNGTLSKIVNFIQDTLFGKAYYFNLSGVLIREAEFKRGKLNGLVKFYASDGELIAIYEYTNSIKGKTKYYKIHPELPPKNHSYRPEY